MKISIYILLLILATNCQNSDDTLNHTDILYGSWNLKNISGGITGINNDFESQLIFWSFNSDNSILTVTNNNSDTTINDGLETGTYKYLIQATNGQSFLFINDSEFGNITIFGNELIINQNIITDGNGADGFIMKLYKVFSSEPI